MGGSPDLAPLTLVDAPQVLGWTEWRTCDGGPFRALLASSIEAVVAARRLQGGVAPAVLADLPLGAVTESALCIVSTADPPEVADDHAATMRSVIAQLTRRRAQR